MLKKYTEQDTESFYDAEDPLYRSFWDDQGSLHWGMFDETTGVDFLKACVNLNIKMAEIAAIDQDSKVLDFGCGNGATAQWLCEQLKCQVVGVDLSGVRIGNAKEGLKGQPAEVRNKVSFEKGSVTSLPFPDASFTHVWSQATIYHVHDKETALAEAYRVLKSGGTFILDDLLKPTPNISDNSRTHVYDRLLFDTDFSFTSYQTALENVGFQVLDAQDISQHLKTSYQCLTLVTRAKSYQDAETYGPLSSAYEHMVQAVRGGELGWGLYLCRK